MPDAPPGDRPQGPATEDDRSFTEKDPRFYALWRLSMWGQFQPNLLAELADSDILFLAGQSSEGYPKEGMGGIALEANKVDGNALRARSELERRSSALGFRRSVRTAVVASVLSSALAAIFTIVTARWLEDEQPPPEVSVVMTTPEPTTTTTVPPTTTTSAP